MRLAYICFLIISLYIKSSWAVDKETVYDELSGKGLIVDQKKSPCENMQVEWVPYYLKTKKICEDKGFKIKKYDATFAPNCKIEYIFQCEVSSSQVKLNQDKDKNKPLLEVNKKEDEQKKVQLKTAIIEKAKLDCADLGYKKDSDKFKDCVLELLK
jgi:hypothetical protein